MKTILYILASVTLCLTSCTKDIAIEPNVQLSVNVNIPKHQTRDASGNITRFIVEIYRAGDNLKPLDFKIFDRISDVSFRVPVGEYDFYFWADYGANNYTIITTLANIVSVGGSAPNGDCFGGVLKNKKIERNGIIDAQLTRRVACVNLINKGIAPVEPSPVVTIKYKSTPSTYNMLKGQALEAVDNLIFTTTYKIAENEPFARSYIFPGAMGTVSMEVMVGDKITKVNGVPEVTNNMVNITGQFTN